MGLHLGGTAQAHRGWAAFAARDRGRTPAHAAGVRSFANLRSLDHAAKARPSNAMNQHPGLAVRHRKIEILALSLNRAWSAEALDRFVACLVRHPDATTIAHAGEAQRLASSLGHRAAGLDGYATSSLPVRDPKRDGSIRLRPSAHPRRSEIRRANDRQLRAAGHRCWRTLLTLGTEPALAARQS